MSMHIGKNKIFILIILSLLILVVVQVSAITAHVIVQPPQGQAPLPVLFTDASEGNPVDWRWNFGDGNTGEGEQVMHTYLVPGTYSVTMTVTDESGATDIKEMPNAISVINNPFIPYIPHIPQITHPFVADFKVSKKTGPAPFQVQFTDMSTGGSTSWNWDFGDGSTDIVQNPVHIYTQPGSYTIRLRTSKDGSTSSKEQKNYITVTAGAVVMIAQSQASESVSAVPTPSGFINPTSVRTTEMIPPSSEVTSESRSASPTPSITHVAETVVPESSDETRLVRDTPFVTFYNQTKSMILDQDIPGAKDMLRVIIHPSILTAGESFSAKIQGIPGEEVHFWITIPESMMNSGNPSIPFASLGQKELKFDDAAGPYQIGAFVPDEKEQKLTIREIIPIDQDHQGTEYYGLARLDNTGTATVVWDTTGATPGEYFIRAESKGSDTDYAMTMRKGAASIEVR